MVDPVGGAERPPVLAPFPISVQVIARGFLVERSANGWLLTEVDTEEGTVRRLVFEDQGEEDLAMAESAASLIRVVFEAYFQRKWSGGLVVSVAPVGEGLERIRELEREEKEQAVGVSKEEGP